MNNQVIVEGICQSDVRVEMKKSGRATSVPIGVSHCSKAEDGTVQEETTLLDVYAYGYDVGNSMAKRAVKGSVMRAVGFLKEIRLKDETGRTSSKIVLLAEHVEFRPREEKCDEL